MNLAKDSRQNVAILAGAFVSDATLAVQKLTAVRNCSFSIKQLPTLIMLVVFAVLTQHHFKDKWTACPEDLDGLVSAIPMTTELLLG